MEWQTKNDWPITNNFNKNQNAIVAVTDESFKSNETNSNELDKLNTTIGPIANRFSCFPSYFQPLDGDANDGNVESSYAWLGGPGVGWLDDFVVPAGNDWSVSYG